ncbi:MAG: PD-(D/E)XK nuclease family protein [Phycisphaerales bacterium]
MAVQFILGRSGTGKTSHCVRSIVDALREPSDRSLLFLVPEQATYQAERAILSDPRVKGFHRLHILSFDRLQFLLLGQSTARPAVSQIGRQMMVHKILRDNLDKLRIFGGSALQPGFAREMANTITELHKYAKDPDEVERLLERLNVEGKSLQPADGASHRFSALKFADIALVFRGYTDALQGRFVDSDAQIAAACRNVATAEIVKGASLWVDGFASFTGGEMALLVEVLKAVDHACVALCIDPADVGIGAPNSGTPARAGLFEPTADTYREMLERFGEARIKLDRPLVLNHVGRFAACPTLAHVEQNLFCLGVRKAKAGGDIRLVAAPSLRCEVQWVARQIVRLARTKDYRYRDIAVVASDLGQYEHYVRAYFEDYGIPFFIDKRKPLNQHPVVELICTALQVVIGGFPSAEVFAYLKTGLVQIDASRTDALENYCLAFGIGGRDWLEEEPWRHQSPDDATFDEKAVNATRDQVARPLLVLRQALCPDGDIHAKAAPAAIVRAAFELLDSLHVRRTVTQWIEESLARGDLTTADEHRQFFDRLVDVFDELVEVFGCDEMTAPEALGILQAAFSQITLAFIPPSLDQVLVGSIERSRHPNLKAVFLLGATQKCFPIPVPGPGLLTDADRDAAESADFHLAPGSAQSLTERRYLAYIAFTRPSAFLHISYPCLDGRGGPVVRSDLVDDLQMLFSDLQEESAADVSNDIAEVRTESELSELLCASLGRDVFGPATGTNLRPAGLLHAMRSDDALLPCANAVTNALQYDNRARLCDGVVEELFAGDMKGSATRLETFAACPYKYFASHTLSLVLRREFRLEPLDLGQFYHHVLDALHKRLAAEGSNLGTVEESRLIDVLREQVAECVCRDPFIASFVRHSGHNAFIISHAADVLEEAVRDFTRMVRAGSFRPVLSEAGFGDIPDAQQNLGPFSLKLPNGRTLSLRGKIDRLDVAQIEGRKVALVIDYKSSGAGAKFSWPEFHHGLDLQLPIYLLALRDTGTSWAETAAGAFCVPITRTPDSASLRELGRNADRFGRKANGLFNGEYAESLDAKVDSGWSSFYNFCVTSKDGQYGRYPISGALRPDEFAAVLEHTRDKIVALAGEIVAGRIDVHPYRIGTKAACADCDYKAVCRFDWQINDYNFLTSKGKLDVVGKAGGQ